MAVTPVGLLEEVDQEITRIHGRVLTAMAQMKIEQRHRLAIALKKPLAASKGSPMQEVQRHGLVTKISIVAAILALLPPVITQIVALIENVSTNWSGAEEISLITGAAVSAFLIVSKAAQAIAAIIKGG